MRYSTWPSFTTLSYMDVLDVVPQVLHGLGGGFPGPAVGVVHIPQGGHRGHGHLVQQGPQPLGVGVDAVGLHQQRDPALFRLGDEFAQLRLDGLIVHLAAGRGVPVAHDAHIGRAKARGHVDVVRKLRNVRRPLVGELQRDAAG